MANETIELYKPWTPDKMSWPACGSLKRDGVPARIGQGCPVSRQGKPILSIPHIMDFYNAHIKQHGIHLIGELDIEKMPFKEVSGLVRREEECSDLKMYVFDMYHPQYPDAHYIHRIEAARIALHDVAARTSVSVSDLPIQIIPWVRLEDEADADNFFELIMNTDPDAEGIVVHSMHKTFEAGKRLWTTQKRVNEPTYDVQVMSFVEAVSKDKEPLGRVGAMIAKVYRLDKKGNTYSSTITVGAGKLTHNEAVELWQQYSAGKFKPTIATIKTKKDDSYELPRQPTFQHWRHDKNTYDYFGSDNGNNS